MGRQQYPTGTRLATPAGNPGWQQLQGSDPPLLEIRTVVWAELFHFRWALGYYEYDASQIPPGFFVTALGCIVLGSNGEIVAHASDDMDCDDVEVDLDCDDDDAAVYPGAPELCDGKDNDCDGACDLEFDSDGDGDGYTACPDSTGSLAGPDGFCGEVPTGANFDCDDARGDRNPGLVEVCNGFDDNCNGLVDEGLSMACYDGPAGTQDVGQCMGGMTHCIRGIQSACTGQIQPMVEACNGLDDDCDGPVDEGTPDMTCGLGVCRVTVPYCAGGQPQQCVPANNASQELCNGLDDDCDGLVDETCPCVHVSAITGVDTNTGSSNDPMATINAAIQHAATTPGSPNIVCVASTTSCSAGNWTFYNEDVVMVDGVSVYGGYEPVVGNAWVRDPACNTEIRGQTGPAVYFGHSVGSQTLLDGFVTSVVTNSGMASSAVMVIEGSAGAVVSNCAVFGGHQGDETYGILVTDDANGNPATPQILNSQVQGGDGTELSVGIFSHKSSPFIQGSCDPSRIDAHGRCTGGCWNLKSIRGHRSISVYPERSFGIWLNHSPGARVDQSAVCSQGGEDAAAISISGDAAGVQVTRSNMTVWGGYTSNDGILLDDCGGASPWIANNDWISSEGDSSGNSLAVGVRSIGDCHPLIEGNLGITGGGEGSANHCRGILCGVSQSSGVSSRCAIVGNQTINGSNGGLPPSSYAILCEDGACGLISQNQNINGRGGVDAMGVYLIGTSSAVLDRNVIQGGCGPTWVTGVFADDSTARIQNNIIGTSLCADIGATVTTDFVALWVANGGAANEPDVHSNAIFGGGAPSACLSTGLVLDLAPWSGTPTGPLGIYRNNLIHPGLCDTSLGVWERSVDADPRIFENNAVVAGLSVDAMCLDEDTTILSSESQLNGLSDMIVGGNIDQGCGFTYTPGSPVVLPSSSVCRNNGTPAGAPAWDYYGDPRPVESAPEIGPDEFQP